MAETTIAACNQQAYDDGKVDKTGKPIEKPQIIGQESDTSFSLGVQVRIMAENNYLRERNDRLEAENAVLQARLHAKIEDSMEAVAVKYKLHQKNEAEK